MKTHSSSFIAHILQTASTKYFGILLSVPSSVLLARGLSPMHRGEYAVVFSIAAIISLFAGMGLAPSNIKLSASKPYMCGVLLVNSLVYSLIVGTVTIIAMIYIHNILHITYTISAAISAIVILTLISGYTVNIMLGIGYITEYNNAFKIIYVGKLALYIVIYLVCPRILCFIAADILLLIIKCIYVISIVGKYDSNIVPSWQVFKEQVHFGLPLHISTVMRRINTNILVFSLRIFHGDSAVAYYSIPQNYMTNIKVFPSTIASLLLPRVSKASVNALKDHTSRLLRVMFVMAIASTVIIILFIRPIISVMYGNEYRGVIPVTQVLFMALPFVTFSQISANYLIGIGKSRIFAKMAMISFICGMVALIALVPSMGVIGAAISVIIVEMVAYVYCATQMIRHAEFKFRDMMIPQVSDFDYIMNRLRVRKTKQDRYERRHNDL